MAPPDLTSRFRGTLAGAIIGNIAGLPFEFLPRSSQKTRTLGLDRSRVARMIEQEHPPHDDDAAQTLLLAQSIIDTGKVDPDDLAVLLVRWQRENARGIGVQTSSVLSRIRAGERWEDASRLVWESSHREAAGNGSLMRFSPVALLDVMAPLDQLKADSLAASRVTHWDDRCGGSCYAAGLVLRSLVDSTPEDAVRRAIEASSTDFPEVAAALGDALECGEEDIDAGGFVLLSLTASVWCLLHSSSFQEAVIMSVKLGGDTDTNGAIAGALAGFRWGLEAIPVDWRAALDRRRDGLPLATQLADSLESLAHGRARG